MTPPTIIPGQPHYDVFLSYNSRDRATVDRIAQRLKRAGLEPWLDRWSLTPGRQWQLELGAGMDASVACAVFVGAHDLGACELEEVAIAIDRAVTQRDFRVFPVLLPGLQEPFDPNRLPHFLRTRTWVDFRRGRDDVRALQDLINAVKGVPFGPSMLGAPDDHVAPYRGLRVFREEDAELFFGRDPEIQRLLEKLKQSTFLAVVGPSGSGKSSLVRAGLVPELRAGALADVEGWQVLVLRPGAAPLTALAAQLATLAPGQAMQATLDRLAQDPRTLHLSVELALADLSTAERVLVVVDQLEEVFTLCRDETERRQLFATLLYATSAPDGRTVVIVTMRSDFYTRCAAYPELAQLITAQQMLVGPMHIDGLRQAIEEPARRVRLELEDGLSDTILADAGAEPGALPLLEHALLELWERRRGSMLTLEGYRQAGGVDGALAQRADAVFGELSSDQQEIARRTLLRLTQPGEGTEDTRRRATRSELLPTEDDDSFGVVLSRLVDARMLTTGSDETGVEIVEVSHEALIRGWPSLRTWIDADRAGLLLHRRLTDAAREWDALKREPAALYRGARLAAAREWAADHTEYLSSLEQDFLTASQCAEDSELEAAGRRTRRLRALATGLAALTVIVTMLAVVALDKRSEALLQKDNARRDAAQATSLALTSAAASPLLRTRPDVSLLLALAAYRASPRPEALTSLLDALNAARRPGLLAILHGHSDTVQSVAFSPNGQMLASASADNTIRLWDARTHKSLGKPLARHTGAVTSVAFSPNGHILASAGADKTIRLWNTRTHTQLGGPLVGQTASVNSVAFSPSGDLVASASGDMTIRLWNVRTHSSLAVLRGHTQAVNNVAFSPYGHTLASASADNTIRLWDARTHKSLGKPLARHTGDVTSVAFSPNGRILASAGADKTIRLWHVRTRKPLGKPLRLADGVTSLAFSRDGRTLASGGTPEATVRLWDIRTHKQLTKPLTGHTDNVLSVTFSPDTRMLASASADDTIRLWDTRQPLRTTLLGHSKTVRSVAFSPDHHTLASAGDDKTVRLWDLRTRNQLGKALAAHTRSVRSVAISPDGRTLASASDDHTIRLWDIRTHEPLGRPLRGPTESVNSVAFSPDRRTLASGSSDQTVSLWDTRTHRELAKPLRAGADVVASVAFSPDGRTLAAASDDHTIRLWDAHTRKQLSKPLRGHNGAVYSVTFSPDGRTLVSAAEDTKIQLWNVHTHKPIGAPLTGHTGAVNIVAFSPDGRTLASASDDKSIRLWDVRNHQPLPARRTGHSPVTSLAFSPDGATLAYADNNKIRLWQNIPWLSFAKLQTDVCNLVGSGLSRSEWLQYARTIPYRQSC